jgi:probable FeS assembly SUF system protein SufT
MSTTGEQTKLSRDTEVVQIPEGLRVRLARGTAVRILQSLGDTFTVMTEYGTMVRIDGKDADSIGKTIAGATDPQAPVPASPDEMKSKIWEALRGVYDPEIPVNVVDLGLVYKNEAVTRPDGGYNIAIDMTLTAPGCGMGPVLQQDAERRIRAIPGAKEVAVQIVIEPAWNQDMMSEVAKLELGLG